jgi:hypothetical protein
LLRAGENRASEDGLAVAKAYPQFRASYSQEEMVEHFLLTPAELQLVLACRGETNLCGMALGEYAGRCDHSWW